MGSRTPRPILFLRALIADGVPARLGTDAFTLAMVIVDQQDRLFWRPIGFYRDQLCDLCGFPRSNPRRLRAARAALMADNWLKVQAPKNGERSEVVYEMVLKGEEINPGQIGSGQQLTPSQNGSGGNLTRAKTAESPGPNRSSDPGQIGTPSISRISIPNTKNMSILQAPGQIGSGITTLPPGKRDLAQSFENGKARQAAADVERGTTATQFFGSVGRGVR